MSEHGDMPTFGLQVEKLFSVIAERRGNDPEASYTASLLAGGPTRCAKKFGEEAVEAIIAAMQGDKDAFRREAADVVFHFAALVAALDLTLDDIAAVLAEREGVSGHTEKAGRGR